MKIPCNGKFSCHQIFTEIAVSINLQKLKSAKYFPIFDKLVFLRNLWRLWLQFVVVMSLRSVFFDRFS